MTADNDAERIRALKKRPMSTLLREQRQRIRTLEAELRDARSWYGDEVNMRHAAEARLAEADTRMASFLRTFAIQPSQEALAVRLAEALAANAKLVDANRAIAEEARARLASLESVYRECERERNAYQARLAEADAISEERHAAAHRFQDRLAEAERLLREALNDAFDREAIASEPWGDVCAFLSSAGGRDSGERYGNRLGRQTPGTVESASIGAAANPSGPVYEDEGVVIGTARVRREVPYPNIPWAKARSRRRSAETQETD